MAGLEASRAAGNLDETIKFLDLAHQDLVKCIQEFPEQDLEGPVKMELPFKSTADLISVLAMHDVSHGAQIRTIRRAYSER